MFGKIIICLCVHVFCIFLSLSYANDELNIHNFIWPSSLVNFVTAEKTPLSMPILKQSQRKAVDIDQSAGELRVRFKNPYTTGFDKLTVDTDRQVIVEREYPPQGHIYLHVTWHLKWPYDTTVLIEPKDGSLVSNVPANSQRSYVHPSSKDSYKLADYDWRVKYSMEEEAKRFSKLLEIASSWREMPTDYSEEIKLDAGEEKKIERLYIVSKEHVDETRVWFMNKEYLISDLIRPSTRGQKEKIDYGEKYPQNN